MTLYGIDGTAESEFSIVMMRPERRSVLSGVRCSARTEEEWREILGDGKSPKSGVRFGTLAYLRAFYSGECFTVIS